MAAALKEFPVQMNYWEMLAVMFFILGVYSVLFMGGLNTLLNFIVKIEDSKIVWQSEGGLWDHPEPNYSVLPFVAEFFASFTAVPLAGGLLLYQSLRFSYNAPVVVLFLLDCWMYTCAFFSHMLLWPLLNAVTLTSVLTNALYTFGVYGGLAGGFMKRGFLRIFLGFCMWLAIVWLVAILPDWFGPNGGVPALLAIQTPAVIAALVGTLVCYNVSPSAFRLLRLSGILLCSAMAVSLVEVLWGRQCQPTFGAVPVFHVCIHVLEQIGIYLYGVGVAQVEHCVIRKVEPANARIEYLFGNRVPYLAITMPAEATAPETARKSSSSPRRSLRLSSRK